MLEDVFTGGTMEKSVCWLIWWKYLHTLMLPVSCMFKVSECIFALLKGKHKTAEVPVSRIEARHFCSWAEELLVELPQAQSRQKGACPSVPSQNMFSVIWRKLWREISTLFSLKPVSPTLYLYHEDVNGCLCFSQILSSTLDLEVYKPWWAGKEVAQRAGDNQSTLRPLFAASL